MTEPIIRRATTADEHALRALAARLGECPLPEWRTPAQVSDADARAMVAAVHAANPDNEVFIAEHGDDAVGCLHILTATDFFGLRHAHLSVIATSREAEGSGVARALMTHAERWTRDRGLSLLTLHVVARNVRARRFYERAGFEIELLRYAKPVT